MQFFIDQYENADWEVGFISPLDVSAVDFKHTHVRALGVVVNHV